MHSTTYVCIPCRNVKGGNATCQFCRQPMHAMYYKWRAPKKKDDKAWKIIEAGDWYWDKKAIDQEAWNRVIGIWENWRSPEARRRRAERVKKMRELLDSQRNV